MGRRVTALDRTVVSSDELRRETHRPRARRTWDEVEGDDSAYVRGSWVQTLGMGDIME